MGKRSFFPRLALVNLIRNSRYYGPYLLSCGALAAMYYILRFLTWNEVIQTVRGAAYLQVMMSIGCFVVTLFSAVLLLYANSFVMKRRQRELGLYNILGLEKRHIAVLCFWETVLCAAAVIHGGIAAGILLSKLILLLLLKLVLIPVQFGFSVSVRGMGETATLLGMLFLLALLWNLLRLGRSRPIELLHSDSAGEREPKTKRLLAVLGLAALLGGCVDQGILESQVRQYVREALLASPYIREVDGFSFVKTGSRVEARFTVHTVYEKFTQTTEVLIG